MDLISFFDRFKSDKDCENYLINLIFKGSQSGANKEVIVGSVQRERFTGIKN